MKTFFAKRAVLISIIIALLGIGLFAFFAFHNKAKPIAPAPDKPDNLGPIHAVIGMSVEGRKIDAYTYPSRRRHVAGQGEKRIAFVGGMHGGYEWNSVVLAYEFMDYLEANPTAVPDNLTVIVIPSINPDGVYKVVGKEGRFTIADAPADDALAKQGRFNARGVDLNRNFDCKWKPESMWRDKVVSAGMKPFSEPETAAMRNFVLANNLDAVVFWHSQSDAVYASQCENGILPETLNIMNAYSQASGYPAVKSFDFYEISGDAEGWLASIGVPAITVELKTHETIEWEKNLAGIKALFEYYK